MDQDRYHYNYSKGYDGDDDNKHSTKGGGFELFNFLDQEEVHFMNSSLNIGYQWKDYFSTGVVLRYDSATTVQSNHRWLFTPAV